MAVGTVFPPDESNLGGFDGGNSSTNPPPGITPPDDENKKYRKALEELFSKFNEIYRNSNNIIISKFGDIGRDISSQLNTLNVRMEELLFTLRKEGREKSEKEFSYPSLHGSSPKDYPTRALTDKEMEEIKQFNIEKGNRLIDFANKHFKEALFQEITSRIPLLDYFLQKTGQKESIQDFYERMNLGKMGIENEMRDTLSNLFKDRNEKNGILTFSEGVSESIKTGEEEPYGMGKYPYLSPNFFKGGLAKLTSSIEKEGAVLQIDINKKDPSKTPFPTTEDVLNLSQGLGFIYLSNKLEKLFKKEETPLSSQETRGAEMGGFFSKDVLNFVKNPAVLKTLSAIAGFLMTVVDVFKGVNLAETWGVSKISGGIGAALGGTGEGLENALFNAVKGALIGVKLGGPPGALIGAIAGGVFGYIGGKKLAEVSDFFTNAKDGVKELKTGEFDEEVVKKMSKKDQEAIRAYQEAFRSYIASSGLEAAPTLPKDVYDRYLLEKEKMYKFLKDTKTHEDVGVGRKLKGYDTGGLFKTPDNSPNSMGLAILHNNEYVLSQDQTKLYLGGQKEILETPHTIESLLTQLIDTIKKELVPASSGSEKVVKKLDEVKDTLLMLKEGNRPLPSYGSLKGY